MAETITRDELRRAIEGEEVVVVETLGPSYYAQGHLPGAINIPHTQVDELARTLLPDRGAAIVTYWKGAGGKQSPIRMIQGDKTKLADPHGLAYDPKEDVIYAANFGSRHDVSKNLTPRTGVPSEGNEQGKENWPLGREFGVPGSGTINVPSVSVYRRTARGNEPPVRVIQGNRTRLIRPQSCRRSSRSSTSASVVPRTSAIAAKGRGTSGRSR